MAHNFSECIETTSVGHQKHVVILPKVCSVSLLNNDAIPNIVRGFLIEIPWAMEIALHNYGLKLLKVL